jgi:predicted DNA-binding antitoxin AbrB/MazE fold protein
VKAVVQDGVLRPLEPLSVPEGREVEVVVRVIPTPEERDEQHHRFRETLRRIREEAARYPDEWWDQFQRDIEGNRMNFGDRC